MARPAISDIFDLLSYDPLSGTVTWKVNRAGGVKAGDVAGWNNGNRGYRRISIRENRAYAHHVAWLFITGEWPEDEIDHENGNPADNRAENLRPASRTENNRNTRARKHNRVGLKGVRETPQPGVWSARIRLYGREIYLGRYRSPHEAHQAYCAAALKLHGDFARFA